MEFEDKTQEMKMINQITLNKIEDLYRISNQIEFYEKICHNTQNISKILSIINKMLNEKIVLSKKESEILLHCLNFVDLMNLFINPNEMDKLCTNIKSIKTIDYMHIDAQPILFTGSVCYRATDLKSFLKV